MSYGARLMCGSTPINGAFLALALMLETVELSILREVQKFSNFSDVPK